MRARQYQPRWGRFISPDPISIAGGPSLYSFTGSRPLHNRDPLGLMTCDGSYSHCYADAEGGETAIFLGAGYQTTSAREAITSLSFGGAVTLDSTHYLLNGEIHEQAITLTGTSGPIQDDTGRRSSIFVSDNVIAGGRAGDLGTRGTFMPSERTLAQLSGPAAATNGDGLKEIWRQGLFAAGVADLLGLAAIGFSAAPEVLPFVGPILRSGAPVAVPAAPVVARILPTPEQAMKLVQDASAIGSALKNDIWHRSASFAISEIASKGTSFWIGGYDGLTRLLVQVPGVLNGIVGSLRMDCSRGEPDSPDVCEGRRYQWYTDQAVSDDLVKIPIPAAFIITRVVLTAREIAYGWQHGWILSQDVVTLALAKLEAGAPITPAEEELTFLSPNNLYEVPNLIAKLGETNDPEQDAAAVWRLLALDWVYTHRDGFDEPLQIVEMLYADFEYPADMEGFVRFMPPPDGASIGLDAITDRWRTHLEGQRGYYRGR